MMTAGGKAASERLRARWPRRLAGAALGACLSGLLTGPGDAQTVGRYSSDFATGNFNPAQPRFSSDTQQLVDQLRLLIDEAERANAADPLFLEDLRAMADQFYWPWRNMVVFDDFSDGDFAVNPQWLNPAGVVSVVPEFGLILDGTGGSGSIPGAGVPPGYTPSSVNAWTGSARSFDFSAATIGAPTVRRAIRMEDSLTGDFTFQFRYGEQTSTGSVVGLFPTASDSAFRSTSGTGRMDRMDDSWWMVGDGKFWQGNRQENETFVQSGDLVEFQRRAGVISVALNGATAHQFSRSSTGPVRAVIAQSGTRRFDLTDVAWSVGSGGPAVVLKRSTADAWDGNADAFSFAGDDILGEQPGNAIRTFDALNGDFRFLVTIGPRATFNSERIGVYDAAEDFRFDADDQTGGMRDMVNSWYFMSDTLRYGCCSEGNLDLSKGNVLEFRRIGDRISVLVNDNLVHTFSQPSTAAVRPVIGRGSFSIGRLDLDNIAWTVPASGGFGSGTPGTPPGDTSSTLDAIRAALLASGGAPGQGLNPNNAVLFAPTNVSQVFAITAVVTPNQSWPGRLDIGILRSSNAFGYRVAVNPASFPALQLIRSDNNGDTVLGSATPPFNLNDGTAHLVQLTRDEEGVVALSVDGATMLRATDLRFGTNFDALTLFARDGLFAIRGVSLMEAPL